MTAFPIPRYTLGPQPTSLVGASAPAHYIFLDAAGINHLNEVFPINPSRKQAAFLTSLFAASTTRPIVLVTTPLELMILDHVKETPEKGKVIKPRIRDFVNVGRGSLVVQSYADMRSNWYSYQPFTLKDLDTTPFKFAGDSVDLLMDSGDLENQRPLLPAQFQRMKFRLDGFQACASILKSHLPDSTITFALLGSRMVATDIQESINHKLGAFGDLHVGNVNLRTLFSKLVDPSANNSTYTDPIPHPDTTHPTFVYPKQELQPLRMDIRSIPQYAPTKHFNVAPTKVIYVAYDTNAHSRLHGELIEMSSRYGANIRLISLPTVAKELARGQGHEAREKSLKSFLVSGRSKAKRNGQLQFRPAPTINAEGTVSREVLEKDLRIRSELELVLRQLVMYNKARQVIFMFVTFDAGCHLLCGSINAGGARLLLPKVDKRDIRDAGRVTFNVLHPHLA